MKKSVKYGKILVDMETEGIEEEKIKRPQCFGDELKFIDHLEGGAADSPCKTCLCEQECGDFILFKCSKELCF